MAGRGRPPKPTAVKELEGNPGKRPLNKNEPKPKQTAPKCPSWLEPDAKKEWRRLSKELESMGLLTEVDMAVFVKLKMSHPINSKVSHVRYNKSWFGNTFLDKFYKVFFSLSIRSLRLPLTTSLHGYEFRRSRQIQMIMPSAFGYHTHAHYQGFASPISVADRQSVFDCPMNHGFADSSTNECSQKAEYVVRLTFQKCVDG